jgi:hypothetical protein
MYIGEDKHPIDKEGDLLENGHNTHIKTIKVPC